MAMSMRERITKSILLSVFGDHELERDAEQIAIDAADVVLAELEKPTEEMIDTAYERASDSDRWAIEDADDFSKAWSAAIRAAREGK